MTPRPHRSTLFLHDALPISRSNIIKMRGHQRAHMGRGDFVANDFFLLGPRHPQSESPENHESGQRSEEHTSELQSLTNLVCRLLLEKKKTTSNRHYTYHTK